MKITTKSILRFSLSIGLLLLLLASCNEKKDKKQTSYDEALASAPCECDDSWFPHSQTSAPAEGKDSPFDTTSTTNCMFQQWSWQKFLWLTKSEGKNPLFLDSLIQVTHKLEVVAPQPGATVVLTDTAQAGFRANLRTNPNYNPNGQVATVFYSIHVNSLMQKAAKDYINQIVNNKLPMSNDSIFPIGSLELKLAWVESKALPVSEIDNYFTTTAAYANGSSGFENKQVALLGMHIVGVVINHPEFIWATFEHKGMGPNFDWTNKTASSSEETLLFTTASSDNLNGIRWDANTGKPMVADQAYELFQFGVPRDLGGAFMKTSQKEPENFNNIEALNQCVTTKLTDVWKNYFHNGAIWINTDGLSPSEQATLIKDLGGNIAKSDTSAVARGSNNLANITMETFTQTFNKSSDPSSIDVSNLVNCFSCHNSSYSGAHSPLFLSHIFRDGLKKAQGVTHEEIEAAKINEFMKTLSEHGARN